MRQARSSWHVRLSEAQRDLFCCIAEELVGLAMALAMSAHRRERNDSELVRQSSATLGRTKLIIKSAAAPHPAKCDANESGTAIRRTLRASG